jgi:DedD protein
MADQQETVDLRRRARRRLIGAMALVLALVIVPPWIMERDPKPEPSRLSVEIPSQDAGRIKPPAKPPAAPGEAIKPQGQATPAKPAESAKAEPARPETARVEAQRPEVARPAPKPAAPQTLDARTVAALGAPRTPPTEAERAVADKPKAVEPSAKPAETAIAAPAAREAYVVPLGSYGNPDNVKQLQARLSQEGIQSYTEPIKTASGERTRVRAGPYSSREAAEEARERVKGMGIDAGNVITRQ